MAGIRCTSERGSSPARLTTFTKQKHMNAVGSYASRISLAANLWQLFFCGNCSIETFTDHHLCLVRSGAGEISLAQILEDIDLVSQKIKAGDHLEVVILSS